MVPALPGAFPGALPGALPGADVLAAGQATANPANPANPANLVNLADTDTTRFIKVTFRLGLNENKLGEEFKDDPVVLAGTRDAIISILSTKTSDELLSIEGKEKLKKDIREHVSKILPRGRVIEVYIMDFVVQL